MPRVSGSCHSRDCAGDTKAAGSDWAGGGRGEFSTPQVPTYHSVLVFFRGIVHSCVPCVGPTSIYLRRVQFPEPEEKREALGTGSVPL